MAKAKGVKCLFPFAYFPSCQEGEPRLQRCGGKRFRKQEHHLPTDSVALHQRYSSWQEEKLGSIEQKCQLKTQLAFFINR